MAQLRRYVCSLLVIYTCGDHAHNYCKPAEVKVQPRRGALFRKQCRFVDVSAVIIFWEAKMPKHGFLTPKAISNRIKSKGLQKLRWYCQMCQKQCRDEVSVNRELWLCCWVISLSILSLSLSSEWVQMSHDVRVSPETDVTGGWKSWQVHWSILSVSLSF